MQLPHPYHIVSPSPWPFYVSMSLLGFFLNLVSSNTLFFSLASVCSCVFCWFSDMSNESSYLGKFTSLVKLNALIWFLHVFNPLK